MNLIQAAEETIKTREEWLKHAQEALAKIKALPENMQNMEADSVSADLNSGSLSMYFGFWNDKTKTKARDCMKDLMRCGVIFQVKPRINYVNQDLVNYNAEQELAGIKVNICVAGLPKPPGCVIKEVPNIGTHLEIECALEQSVA